jgi:hypothetical protein
MEQAVLTKRILPAGDTLTRRSQITLLSSLFFAVSMWFYFEKVLIPSQVADEAAHGRSRGNLSDLYPRWWGTRELLLHHRDPYSSEVTREIQTGYYGRALDPNRPDDPKDQQAFAYPLYVVFLFAPTILLTFSVVHTLFLWLLVFITGLSCLLWVRMIGWKLSAADLTTVMILVLNSLPAVQGLKLQQLSLLVCGLIAICMVLLIRGQLLSAGGVLALATIKPQLVMLLVGWLILWAFGDWRVRQYFVYGFGVVMSILLVGAQLLLPGWIWRFSDGLVAYQHYTGESGSTLDMLFTPIPGRSLAVLLIFGVMVVCWRSRRMPAASHVFMLTTALVLAVTVVVIPKVSLYNQLLLLPAIFILLKNRQWFHGRRFLRLLQFIGFGAFFWPWFSAGVITTASLFATNEALQSWWILPIYTSLAIPPMVLALLVLYLLRLPHLEVVHSPI